MKRGVVIVGSGLIARFHAQAVRASEKLELKGFCDTFSLESAKRAAAEFGGEAWGGSRFGAFVVRHRDGDRGDGLGRA